MKNAPYYIPSILLHHQTTLTTGALYFWDQCLQTLHWKSSSSHVTHVSHKLELALLDHLADIEYCSHYVVKSGNCSITCKSDLICSNLQHFDLKTESFNVLS